MLSSLRLDFLADSSFTYCTSLASTCVLAGSNAFVSLSLACHEYLLSVDSVKSLNISKVPA